MSPEISVLQMFHLMSITLLSLILSQKMFPFRSVRLEGLICFILIPPHGSLWYMLPAFLNYSFMQCCVLPSTANLQAFHRIGVPLSAALWKAAAVLAMQKGMTGFCIITRVQGGIQKMPACIISLRYTDTISDS